MQKEAKHWIKLKDKTVQCRLCPHNCVIEDKKFGFCGVRQNNNGKLFTLVYGKPVSTHVDPIEKKPLFHFYPGSKIFSFGTVGCNLRCKFCQNWEISQAKPDEYPTPEILPEKIVEMAIEAGCDSIAYTYTEPTIFFEYVLDTAKIAREKGLKNVMVTNGYINKEPLEELYPFIDAVNVDLKGFTEEYYKEITMADLKSVLETLKRLKKFPVWIEVTNLIIPNLNDNPKKIKEMCEWIKENLGENTPVHFSRFFPMYKLLDKPPTSQETLKKAYDIAKEVGLNYVYIGNLEVEKEDNTYCPKCKKLLVSRSRFGISENNLDGNKCPCGEEIAGVWK